MKQLRYIIFALLGTVLASCMGDSYADPELNESPYGNNELTETNVITIAQLKSRYASVISTSSMVEVKEDIKIKGRITGNDIGSNIYGEVALQDETGALLVCINQGGLYGYLPVGQEVLISLQGLMVGGYGQQLEVGSIYTNTKTGAQSVGRMSRYTWNTHYKLIGTAEPSKVEAEDFDLNMLRDEAYMQANCGKLMTLRGVVLKDADGKAVYAPDDGSVTLTANCANRAFKGISSSYLVLRTSTYADFANMAMPTEELDVTGIFTRYRNTWQILIRSLDDIASAKKFSYDDLVGSGQGTEESPFNVARALALAVNSNNDASKEVYITGIISNVNEVSTEYGNTTYYISDDGTEEQELQVFRGRYLNGEKINDTNAEEIRVGRKIVLKGKLTLYNGEPEVGTGSSIISIQ